MNAQSTIEAASPAVYSAIAAVMADIAKDGISKDRRNQQQGYNFRGIDEVYNALSPILARHKLCILPRMVGRDVSERTTAKGGALFYVVVEAEFDFIAAEDGSRHTIRTFGEAMDSGDKATNKAMSAAYKYAAMQAFCIPTEGDNDADNTTHDVAPRDRGQQRDSGNRQQQDNSDDGMPAVEWSKLVQLVEATKPDTKAMLKHYGVKSLRFLNQNQYAEVVERLNDILAKQAKEQTDRGGKSGGDDISDDEIPY